MLFLIKAWGLYQENPSFDEYPDNYLDDELDEDDLDDFDIDFDMDFEDDTEDEDEWTEEEMSKVDESYCSSLLYGVDNDCEVLDE